MKTTARPLVLLALSVTVIMCSTATVAGAAGNWLVHTAVVTHAGEARAQALPSAPAGVSASCAAPTTAKTIKVSWSAVTHATAYTVYDSTTSATGTYSLIASGVSTTSWTSSALTSTTNYWFEVATNVGSNWTEREVQRDRREHDQQRQPLLRPAVAAPGGEAHRRRPAVQEGCGRGGDGIIPGVDPSARAKDVAHELSSDPVGDRGGGPSRHGGCPRHPELELVGAWVHSPDKEGADLGTLVGGETLGVTATGDVDALLATEADCVLYSPIFADPATL